MLTFNAFAKSNSKPAVYVNIDNVMVQKIKERLIENPSFTSPISKYNLPMSTLCPCVSFSQNFEEDKPAAIAFTMSADKNYINANIVNIEGVKDDANALKFIQTRHDSKDAAAVKKSFMDYLCKICFPNEK